MTSLTPKPPPIALDANSIQGWDDFETWARFNVAGWDATLELCAKRGIPKVVCYQALAAQLARTNRDLLEELVEYRQMRTIPPSGGLD